MIPRVGFDRTNVGWPLLHHGHICRPVPRVFGAAHGTRNFCRLHRRSSGGSGMGVIRWTRRIRIAVIGDTHGVVRKRLCISRRVGVCHLGGRRRGCRFMGRTGAQRVGKRTLGISSTISCGGLATGDGLIAKQGPISGQSN